MSKANDMILLESANSLLLFPYNFLPAFVSPFEYSKHLLNVLLNVPRQDARCRSDRIGDIATLPLPNRVSRRCSRVPPVRSFRCHYSSLVHRMYLLQSNNPGFSSTLSVFTGSTVIASNIGDAEVRLKNSCTFHTPNTVLYN